MQIKIDDKYQIGSDARQYILQECKTVLEGDRKGETYLDSVGYYNTIYSALKAYKEAQIRNSDVTTIDELMDLIKELDVKIETLLKSN